MRPDVGGLLPVFVIDRYEGYEVKRLQDCTRAELDAWVEANAAAIREHAPADLLLRQPRPAGWGRRRCRRGPVRREGARVRARVLDARKHRAFGVGWRRSAQMRRPLWSAPNTSADVVREVCGTVERVREIRARESTSSSGCPRREGGGPRWATRGGATSIRRTREHPNERLPDESNALRLAEFLAADRPTVVYYGKLIENKGVQVLLEALRGLEARTVIVGFGDYRDDLERDGRGPRRSLRRSDFEHRHLVHLLALADVAVVPSIFPEAFGMVAAEAAAAGCPPIVADPLRPGRGRTRPARRTVRPAAAGSRASRERRRRGVLRFARLEEVLALRGDERQAPSRRGAQGGGRALELDERRRAPSWLLVE